MTTTAPARPRETKATHFQPHIQGLRAIAVILVVLYHFWPGRLSGGYIGVDIFFVISGFLITGQLARELDRSGTIALPAFWAKRARRLLPASLTVLFFGLLATLFILPLSSLVDSLREIVASAFYVENWSLALGSVDYLASHDATLAQHYWSLSLEEQFYLFWPLLLLAASWFATRSARSTTGRFKNLSDQDRSAKGENLGDQDRPSNPRWIPMFVIVVAATVVSLIISVVYTRSNPAEAFFVTQTRVWEFGAGAILALLPRLRPTQRWLSNLLGFAGILIILVCAYRYNQDTQFPGTAAILPVIGTMLVIVSARATRWYDAGGLLGIRPARFIGDISYSVYLWHWPLIIIAPYIPGWGLDGWNRIVLFLGAFVLGWLSKKFIEDPARTWTFLTSRKPRVTFGFVIAGMAVISLVAAGVFGIQNPHYQAASAQLRAISANPPACFGALSGPDCVNPALKNTVIPDAGFGNADKPGHDECFVQLNESGVTACHFGSRAKDAPRIALIGDSHAYQYVETMIRLADTNGWSLTTYLKGACPWNTTPIGGPSVAFTNSCKAWLSNLSVTLSKVPTYDAIVVGALHDTPYPGANDATIASGFVNAWKQAKGAPIVTMIDNPDFLTDPNKCLRTSSPADCTEARSDVLPKVDPLALASAQVAATPVDLTNTYCNATRCFSVIGGANVYRDQDHLTVTWTLTMQKVMGDAISDTLAKHAKAPLE